MISTFTPSNEQYLALVKASEVYGRTWRTRLTHNWETGDYHADLREQASHLQHLRNVAGSEWLYKFKFNSPNQQA